MPRIGDIPECPAIPTREATGSSEHEYEIRLITPMFGGGVDAGQPDESFPIRPTAIRGQLRYWWRLAVGQALDDRMWQREEEIFGSTEFPSPLTVNILSQPRINLVDPTYGDRFGPIAYALFPAVENEQKVVQEEITFRMCFSWADESQLQRRRCLQNDQRKKNGKKLLPTTIDPIQKDVEMAFKTWIAFGGIGGRTRRGCGALRLDDSNQTASELAIINGTKVFIGTACNGPMDAWKQAVGVYQQFRQTPRGGRHPKTIQTRRGPKSINVPGRSHWSEADSIRQITGCSLKPQPGTSYPSVPADQDPHDHSTPVVPSTTLPSFPKAILGLPINFHFADSPGKNRPGEKDKDPQDVQLYPLLPNENDQWEKAERMASPIITRPLWKDGKWYPGIIVLPHELPENFGVRIEGQRSMAGGAALTRDLNKNRVVGASLSSLRPMRGKDSAIQALIEFLTEKNGPNFTEIKK